MRRGGLRVLCAAKLHANQLERHLELFEHLPEVERVIVVRHESLPERLSKVENVTFRPGPLPVQLARFGRAIDGVLETERIDWVVGFNPVPWGALAMLAARRRGVPVCLGLIGMDFLHVQRAWGRVFLEALRRADAVTVTGARMTEGLERLGVPSERISVLPHSVDVDRFLPSEEPPQLDVISVGQLIHRKRMDVLLAAIARLNERGRRLTLGILGRGPLEEELREQARARGIAGQVHFLGYRDDVERVVASARIFALVSEWEGVPFALMEALAAGLVPVVTDVGTISDWIRDGDNGRVVPVGDVSSTAEALAKLTDPGGPYDAMRAVVVAERSRLSFEAGADVWRRSFAREVRRNAPVVRGRAAEAQLRVGRRRANA